MRRTLGDTIKNFARIGSRRVRQHRLTTARRGAPAHILGSNLFIRRVVNGQQIFNEQFFSCVDRPECVNENAIAVFNGFTVGRACVVEPTCAVAAPAAINDASVRKTEKERMPLDTLTPVPANGIAPRRDFALVLEHTLSRSEPTYCEHAFAMN